MVSTKQVFVSWFLYLTLVDMSIPEYPQSLSFWPGHLFALEHNLLYCCFHGIAKNILSVLRFCGMLNR